MSEVVKLDIRDLEGLPSFYHEVATGQYDGEKIRVGMDISGRVFYAWIGEGENETAHVITMESVVRLAIHSIMALRK